VQEEGKKQAERGDRSTPSQSMTSLSMFAAFRSDIKFPPIIGSNSYKQNKHLGLCTKIHAPADPESLDTSKTESSISQNPTMTSSQTLEEPQNIVVPTFAQNNAPILPPPVLLNSAPVMPPPPGVVLPPPPMSVGQLLLISQNIGPTSNINQSNSSAKEEEEDEARTSGLSYKDTLAMMIAKTQGGPAPEKPKEPEVTRKSVLQSLLTGNGQKVTPAGFFDDDDDELEGQSLLKKKNKPTEVESVQPIYEDRMPETKTGKRPNTLFEAILTGEAKKEPVKVVEDNPFSKRPAKGKKNLFDEDDEEEAPDQGKKRKVDKFLNDDSDEEKERQKLLKKYGKKESVLVEDEPQPKKDKDQKEKPTKLAKKATLLEDSDDEIPLPKKTEKKPKAEPPAPVPVKEVPKEKPAAPKKAYFDSEEEEQVSQPKKATGKSNDFLSKLNAQLGQGPKEGMGLIKSVVQDPEEEYPEEKPVVTEAGPLNQNYRSLRGSVDDRGSIKPISDKYFEQSEETSQFEQKLQMKKHKKSSVSNLDDDKQSISSNKQASVAEPQPPKREAPAPVKKEEPKNQEPQMLRGKRKDPFASSSGSEDEAPKPPPRQSVQTKPEKAQPVAETPAPQKVPEVVKKPEPPIDQPTMLRGNRKKDPFASDSESEEAVKPKPTPVTQDSSQGGRVNKLFDQKQEKPPAKEQDKPVTKPAKGKTTFADDSDDDIKPSKLPQAKAGKKIPALEDSDDDKPAPSKAKPTMKAAGSKLFAQDSDEEVKPKKAAAGGKKKLFEDSD
jgi:hypothetical protein